MHVGVLECVGEGCVGIDGDGAARLVRQGRHLAQRHHQQERHRPDVLLHFVVAAVRHHPGVEELKPRVGVLERVTHDGQQLAVAQREPQLLLLLESPHEHRHGGGNVVVVVGDVDVGAVRGDIRDGR